MALSVTEFIAGAKDLHFEDELEADDDSGSIGLIKGLPDQDRSLLLLIRKCREQKGVRDVFNTAALVSQPIVPDPADPAYAQWLEDQRKHSALPKGQTITSTRWGSDNTTRGGGVEGLLRELGFATHGLIQDILHAANTNVIVSTHHPETAEAHGNLGIALTNAQEQRIFVDIVANLALSTRTELQRAELDDILSALPAIETEARSVPPLPLRPLPAAVMKR